MSRISEYNRVLNQIAVQNTAHLGIDTRKSRVAMAGWLRKLRREYPYREMREDRHAVRR